MSTVTATSLPPRRWMSEEELHSMGFKRTRPEVDYGMRWGEAQDVRVSFAPYADSSYGFLYAYRKSTDQYLLLAARTTAEQVQAAWRELLGRSMSPDDFLAFASLDSVDAPMPVEQARQLLMHCVEEEMAAHREFMTAGADAPVRFDAAYNVVVQRSTRVAAEDLQLAAAKVAAEGTPVVIRYRVLDESRWTGRVAGESMESAAQDAKRIQAIGERYGHVLQATSVSQGHAAVSAARVPELAFMSQPPAIPTGAPRLEI